MLCCFPCQVYDRNAAQHLSKSFWLSLSWCRYRVFLTHVRMTAVNAWSPGMDWNLGTILAVTHTTWKALQLAVSEVLFAVKDAEVFGHSSFVFVIVPKDGQRYPCRRMFHALFAFLGIFIPVGPCCLFSLVRWRALRSQEIARLLPNLEIL